mgnify:CR=1 FL=1
MPENVDLNDPKQQELFKKVLTEAIEAWLDKQYVRVGKWTIGGIFSAALGVLAYAYLSTKGLK